MHLKHIDTILLVEDITISRRFYAEALGMEILHDWGTMVIFTNRLAVHQASELQPREEAQKFVTPGFYGRGNVVIYLQSDDLDASYRQLKEAGAEIIHPILTLPWERIFRIYDPDHYVIEIGEPHE